MTNLKKVLLIFLGGIFFFVLGGVVFSKKAPQVQESLATPLPTVEGVQTETGETSAPAQIGLYKIERVIDGDTIEIEGGQKVRLIGIDTPELGGSGSTTCFGREAYDYLDKLLAGKSVRLEKDISETDRYGRLLRFIYLGDVLINDKLVRDGYARVYTYPPDVKFQDKFKESEKSAREKSLGLWSKCMVTTSGNSTTIIKQVIEKGQTVIGGNVESGSFSCDCSKACTEISSCAEAQYQLKTCGCSKRDGDGDGIACDGAPLNCQN